jgi:hypothetical protein
VAVLDPDELAARVAEDGAIHTGADLVGQLLDRHPLAAPRCAADQDVISLGLAKERIARVSARVAAVAQAA